jgi:hypothetical protein
MGGDAADSTKLLLVLLLPLWLVVATRLVGSSCEAAGAATDRTATGRTRFLLRSYRARDRTPQEAADLHMVASLYAYFPSTLDRSLAPTVGLRTCCDLIR